jgi:type II secretory ATPase GspE/PulE/Tfp pilus assembly ATPase PilB-like protein
MSETDPAHEKAVLDLLLKPGGKFLKAKGCPKCKNTGYHGRTGVFELLVPTDALRNFIITKSKSDISELRAVALQSGMKSLLMDAVAKIRMGITTQEEVGRVVEENF